jgi:hypothetical protein
VAERRLCKNLIALSANIPLAFAAPRVINSCIAFEADDVRLSLTMEANEETAASLRNLFFAAEQAHAEACKEGAALEQLTSAESSLLQLQCLLSVTAGQAPAGRHQADELLQQCISRLQGLSVQKRKSDARCFVGEDVVGREGFSASSTQLPDPVDVAGGHG